MPSVWTANATPPIILLGVAGKGTQNAQLAVNVEITLRIGTRRVQWKMKMFSSAPELSSAAV
jgi:hypothetical protein